ncbi:receptor-like protein kinase 5 [Hordeum vulgare subsp. vulgare]|nr:receptor-like protein kinase 5 [Hordeum vulgare subsp. vulgare]
MAKPSQSVLVQLAAALLFPLARSDAASPTSTVYDELRSRGFPRGLLRANVTLDAGSEDFALDLISSCRILLPAYFCLTRRPVAVGFDRSLQHDEFMGSLRHELSGHVDELLGRVVADPAARCLVTGTFFVLPVTAARKLGITYATEPALIFNLYHRVHLLTKNGHFRCNEPRKDTITYITSMPAIEPRELMLYLQETDTTTLNQDDPIQSGPHPLPVVTSPAPSLLSHCCFIGGGGQHPLAPWSQPLCNVANLHHPSPLLLAFIVPLLTSTALLLARCRTATLLLTLLSLLIPTVTRPLAIVDMRRCAPRSVRSSLGIKTYFLHFLVVVLLLAGEANSRITTKEHKTLLAIKKEWGNPPQLASWDTTDHCSWPGVSCMARGGGLVTGLSFKRLNLTGNIPPSMCNLKYLIHLDFSYNKLTARFPGITLYACSWLRYLDLSNNCFHGVLPQDISRLAPSLKHLNLTNNNFSGVLPMAIAELSALQNLLLDTNGFTGEIPEAFSSLKELTTLDLWGNKLSGSIPVWIWQHQKLEFLYLYDNRLTGELPCNITAVNLIEIDLSSNKLTGCIPEDFGTLKKITDIILYHNEFTGPIPRSIGFLPNLRFFQLFDNILSGEVPPELGKHSPLENFEVYNNNLSGLLPEQLCANRKLFNIVVSNNSFSGELPASIGNCLSLKNIMLENNNFSGEFPVNIWLLPLVHRILISDNDFIGTMSEKISSNISRIEMQNNHFSGPIPTFATGLLVLMAQNNQLSGKLPLNLSNLHRLSDLSISGNNISGSIPPSIVLLQNLKSLDLSNNHISGAIPPASIGSILSLTLLDLSSNELTGNIPPDFGNHPINSLNLSFNHLHGEVPLPLQTVNYNYSFLGNPGLCAKWGSRIHLHKCHRGAHLIIWLVLGLTAVIACIIVIWLFFRRRKKTEVVEEVVTDWKMSTFTPDLGFTESDVLSNISEENAIGKGGSGKVYRVHLPSLDGSSNNRIVAVKKIDPERLDGMQFDSEVKTLGSINHNNVIKLLCSISSQDTKLLVYEYMENGSLDDWLHGRKGDGDTEQLSWPRRLAIAIDAANGLHYIHQKCGQAIIHRDIKSANILLDRDFHAKIADFGLARTVINPGQSSHISEHRDGTPGYIAPEYWVNGRTSQKTDVYSFGVVLLELTTGLVAKGVEESEGLAEWAWRILQDSPSSIKDKIDQRIRGSAHLEDIIVVLKLGVFCTSPRADMRPSMEDVRTQLMKTQAGAESMLRKTQAGAESMLRRSWSKGETSSSQYDDGRRDSAAHKKTKSN